jgi:3-dehydroquinate synthetase
MKELHNNSHLKTKIYKLSSAELCTLLQEDRSDVTIIIDTLDYEAHKDIFAVMQDRIIQLDVIGKPKDMLLVKYVMDKLIEHKITCNAKTFIVGDTVLIDAATIAVSMYINGIQNVSYVPTTLLSTLSSAIAPIHTINSDSLQDIAGVHFSSMNTYACYDFITFESRELTDGFAEMFKLAFLFDYDMMQDVMVYMSKYGENSVNMFRLADMIEQSIDLKRQAMLADKMSQTKPKLLSFGNTFGNLVKAKYNIPHHKAISYGMVLETKLAATLEFTDWSIYSRIRRILYKYFISESEQYDIKTVLPNIIYDYKVDKQQIEIPVLVDIGIAKLQSYKLTNIYTLIPGNKL